MSELHCEPRLSPTRKVLYNKSTTFFFLKLGKLSKIKQGTEPEGGRMWLRKSNNWLTFQGQEVQMQAEQLYGPSYYGHNVHDFGQSLKCLTA